MPKVTRTVVVDGAYAEIACAVRSDGTVPAMVLLEELEQGVWNDPQAVELPDERQVDDRIRLLALIEMLGEDGEIPRDTIQGGYNRLGDQGMWELKVGTIRLTFYDTDGVGGFVPKLGTKEDTWNGYYWQLPDDFDEFIRLGFAFGKSEAKTKRDDLYEAHSVRAEDLEHDTP